MKILVAGAGPAGCILLSRQAPASRLADPRRRAEPGRFHLRLRRGVLGPRARIPARDDAETYERITLQMEMWTDLVVVHRGTPVRIDGIGFAAIAG